MIYLQVFLVGAVFSFLGSIPPGTLNVSVLQLGLDRKIGAALRFSLAVAIVEYPYAWIAVEFENLITSTPAVVQNFQLLTAVVLTGIGIVNIWAAQRPTKFTTVLSESGFRRGIILSLLNPMAIPFWIAYTAYFKAQGWIDLSSPLKVHLYVLGTSVGVMILLILFTYLAHRMSQYVTNNKIVKLVPGVTLLVLGVYAFVRYLF
jgi:threonine/homoserine/homoserine lactone efflux protein